MKFGVCLPQYGRGINLSDLSAVSGEAETLGFDSVWVSDHVITPQHLLGSLGPVFLDAFVVLSHVSALTKKVRLGTSVLVTPYRNPVVAAKMVSSLDSLSGGRVILGVGVGGAPDEFAALGVRESRRGALTDEYLSAMIELWINDPSSFAGKYVRFDGVRFAPKPTQQPHPPIWVGGRSDAALRRAVRFGQAWHPTRMPLPLLVERMDRLAEFSREAGRDGVPETTLHLPVAFDDSRPVGAERPTGQGSPAQVAEDLAVYSSMGIGTVVCNFRGGSTDEIRRAMESFARHVLPGLAG